MAIESPIHQLTPRDAVVRVVQLTDTHLNRNVGGTLLGMDTDHSLQSVIDLVQRERPQMDLVLGTGDLSDHGSLEAYQRLLGYFAQLQGQDFWLPGNHDRRELMAEVAQEQGKLCTEIQAGNWQILLLDSQLPGEVGGHLGENELKRLETALARAAQEGRYSLVCLHHQPVPVGSHWLDQQMVADADAFFAILDQYPGVRAVLWGHVHQQVDIQRKGVALLASPSTCVQFAPDCVDFKADSAPPGYRWLELGPDGSVDSGVSRVMDVEFSVDLESDGYQ